MNWYGTAGTGSQTAAGSRASDTDSMCGNAIMYDAVAGKILTIGGAPNYVSKYDAFHSIWLLSSLIYTPHRFHNSGGQVGRKSCSQS